MTAHRFTGDFDDILQDRVRHWSKERCTSFLLELYQVMYAHFGELGWWPAETREEVIIGAILVQNVSWQNTVKAINRLREAGMLSFAALKDAPLGEIGECIRSTRYYNTKARKLQAFARHVADRYNGRLDAMLAQSMETLRNELLNIWGIGPETADDILLYAAGHPSFVVDAYTRRIFHRLGVIQENAGYEPLRAWFMARLPADVDLFNRYHAMLDAVGHRYCLASRPRCTQCPLAGHCLAADGYKPTAGEIPLFKQAQGATDDIA